jgi:ribosome-binding factor A
VPGYRPARIAELVHEEVARRLRVEVKDPRLTDISITRVEVPRDLGRATVFYLPLGGGEPSAELRKALGEAGRQLRGPVGRALRIRHAPEIVFVLDTTTEAAIRVTQILSDLERARQPSDTEEDSE